MTSHQNKQNCWEYMNCGREVGGAKADELGICPASTDTRFDGVNGGLNAGRCCWASAGTLCGGMVQGTFAQKQYNCRTCDFFLQVQGAESLSEGALFKLAYRILMAFG